MPSLGIITEGPSRDDGDEARDEAEHITVTEEIPYSTFDITQKWNIVCLCGFAAFFSTFSAFTYFPALEHVADDLDTTLSPVYVSVTVYLVTQGVAPVFFGDLADQIGRRPVYLVALAVYVAACIGLALQRSYAALMVLRILQSAECSGEFSL